MTCPANSACDDVLEACVCDDNYVPDPFNSPAPVLEWDGHDENTDIVCVDVDECEYDIHDCVVNEYCNNTDGSFECLCKAGYSRENSAWCTGM